jgi:hypothetical protein
MTISNYDEGHCSIKGCLMDENSKLPQTRKLDPESVEKHFTPQAIDYWKQVPPDQFIDAIRHEMMNFFMPIIGFTELIYEQGDLDNVIMQVGESKLTLREFCDVVFRQQDKVYHMRDLLTSYAKEMRNEKA